MDAKRSLYLIAYDVSDPRRLHKVCRYLTGYKVGGQKSVFEILATAAELRLIRAELEQLLNGSEDRAHIVALDPRMQPRLFGRATHFANDFFAIV